MGRMEKDLISNMLEDRTIVISGDVNTDMANLVIAKLLFFEDDDSKKDITLFIDSLGGSVTEGIAIYDTIKFIKSNVNVVIVGDTGGISLLIALAGTKRTAYSNVILGFCDSYSIKETKNKEKLQNVNEKIYELFSINTGIRIDEIKRLMHEEETISAKEAYNRGLIDVII